ncbi:hypothetical protein P9112_010252 [Eukaryota sp. TZLM1-RC]
MLIGSSAQDLVINDSIVPFTNYSSDAFKFLGCWLGNVPQIQNELQVILEKMKIELDSISSLDIEKHIKFFMLKICYTGRITHILRSCAPSIALDFCRSFNSLRTEFFADLLDVEPGMLKSHLFSSANLGGNSREITTTHLLNCKHFITFRSKVHDAVRDQLYCMCKSHRIESFLEPLLSNLFDAENDFHKNNRGDVILPGLDGSFILLDVMSVDPCNASNERLVNSEIHNPLSNAENFKFKKI